MRSISLFSPKSVSLFLVLIGIGLLLVACSGAAEQATTITTAPSATESVSTAHEDPPDTSVASSPEPIASTMSSDVTTNAPETTSTTSPTATAEAYPTRKPASAYADLQVITLLPPDAIPAVDNPQFLPADEADEFYDAGELVIGVSFNGESRAYSVPFLSNHEIVNDTVGGVKLAVTW